MSVPELDCARFLEDATLLSVDQQVSHARTLGPPETVVPALAEHIESLSIADLAKADRASEMVLRLAQALGPPASQARAGRARGHVLAYSNRYDEALDALNASAGLADLAKQPIEAARARLALLHVFARLARYDDAITAGSLAYQAFVEAGEQLLAAKAQINLGVVHRMRDDPATALEMFDSARPKLASNPVALAQLDSNRAEAMLDLNRFADAQDTFRSALAVFEQQGVWRAAAIVEGNLADMMSRQGRLERALYHFEHARRHMEDNAAPGDLARLAAEQAEALAAVGLYEESVSSYEGALPILAGHGLIWEEARANAGLGRALLRLGRRSAALSRLQAAGAAFNSLGHKTGCGRIALLRGELAWANGEHEIGRRLVSEALELLGRRTADAAAAHHALACMDLESQQLDSCDRRIATALEAVQRLRLAPLLADLLQARAHLRKAQGSPGAAIVDLRNALEQIERVRGTLQAERFRAAFLGQRESVYEDLVDALLAQEQHNATAEAFVVAERAKSRSLLDRMTGALDTAIDQARGSRDASEDRIQADLVRCTGELNALYRRIDDILPGDRELRLGDDWSGQIDQRERELALLESRLGATRGVGGLFARPLDVGAVQALLQPHCVLIEYFMCRGHLVAFAVRPEGLPSVHRLVEAGALHQALRRFGFQVSRCVARAASGRAGAPSLLSSARSELGRLHDLLIRPLRPELNDARRLIIVPHGRLHALPFHALWDGREHLVEQYEVVYAPSASVLANLSIRDHSPKSRKHSTLVVGVPDPLAPQIHQEVESIATATEGARILFGPDATVQAFMEEAADASLIHLACHGRFLPSSPLSSGLKFADRWLTVRDLYGLRVNGPLVVLSACETGMADVGAADELAGLLRGFLAAGASSVISSLWALKDQTAAKMMASLYKTWYRNVLRNGSDLGATMRAIQCQTLKEEPHPAFWAPFMLVGNP